MTVDQFKDFCQNFFNTEKYAIYQESISTDPTLIRFLIKQHSDISYDIIWCSNEYPQDNIDYDETAANILLWMATPDVKATLGYTSLVIIAERVKSPKIAIVRADGSRAEFTPTIGMLDAMKSGSEPFIKVYDPPAPSIEPLLGITHSVKISEDNVETIQMTVDGSQSVKPGFEIGAETIKMPNGPYDHADVEIGDGRHDTFIVEIPEDDEEHNSLKELIDDRNRLIEEINCLWYLNENDHWLKVAKMIVMVNTLNSKLMQLEYELIVKRIKAANDKVDTSKNTK